MGADRLTWAMSPLIGYGGNIILSSQVSSHETNVTVRVVSNLPDTGFPVTYPTKEVSYHKILLTQFHLPFLILLYPKIISE